jgi:hypothetical protein
MRGLKRRLFVEAARNYRAATILSAFFVTLGFLSIERVSWKDGDVEIHLRDASAASIVAGLVSATLVVDRDAKGLLAKFLEKK